MLTQEQKDNAQKLITALRSGEYKQAGETLCQLDVQRNAEGFIEYDDNGKPVPGDKVLGYCCLGVAAKVLGYEDREITNFSTIHNGIKATGSFLPDEVAEKFGFTVKQQGNLAELNDRPLPFTYIADELEEWVNSGKEWEYNPPQSDEE